MNIKEMINNKMKEKQKKQMAKIIIKVTTGAIAGMAAGVIGGVLAAPKSGKEIRDDISKTAKDIGESTATKTVEIKEIFDTKIGDTKNNLAVAKEKITNYLSDRNKSKNEVAIEENEEIDPIDKTEE
jgi:gas vesicle protein